MDTIVVYVVTIIRSSNPSGEIGVLIKVLITIVKFGVPAIIFKPQTLVYQ